MGKVGKAGICMGSNMGKEGTSNSTSSVETAPNRVTIRSAAAAPAAAKSPPWVKVLMMVDPSAKISDSLLRMF